MGDITFILQWAYCLLITALAVKEFGRLSETNRLRIATDPSHPVFLTTPSVAPASPVVICTRPSPDWAESLERIQRLFTQIPGVFPGLDIIFEAHSIYPDGFLPAPGRTIRWCDLSMSETVNDPEDTLKGAAILYHGRVIGTAGWHADGRPQVYANGRPQWRATTGHNAKGPYWSLH